ncbi:hypothetical protein GFL54_31630 [Rhizobium laguerreae]|uniref:hypothetical protein n=1 Tax=Rhizobium laguerreae TaxID=1076926 RepID=UPI00143F2557|nr:hypothetical protein [Rhizobium laguerreae]NKM88708.1 hypothetical protein [Rhizobium laguerreae]
MEYDAGVDVSLKESSVCVVDATGKMVREVKLGSEPECLVGYFARLEFPVKRIGLLYPHVAFDETSVRCKSDARGLQTCWRFNS